MPFTEFLVVVSYMYIKLYHRFDAFSFDLFIYRRPFPPFHDINTVYYNHTQLLVVLFLCYTHNLPVFIG